MENDGISNCVQSLSTNIFDNLFLTFSNNIGVVQHVY